MDHKPLISVNGDNLLISHVKSVLADMIRKEPTEWRRSYGRPLYNVHIDVGYCSWNASEVKKSSEHLKLLNHSYIYTYWTDCNDIETYKTTIKDDISNWLMCLRSASITEWAIIVAINSDKGKGKQSKLLSRTNLFDKVKSDFCTKPNDKERCLLLYEPLRHETKSSESWQQLVGKLKPMLIKSFTRDLARFEEHVRRVCEERREVNWDFVRYLKLLEELMGALEMFGLYEDAVGLCDELDGVFLEAVLTARKDKVVPEWLRSFTKPLATWDGISTSHVFCQDKRQLILTSQASVLDFRGYVYSRVSGLLLLMCKPWDVAHYALRLMHSAVSEMKVLKVPCDSGSIQCWILISSLHTIYTCDRFKDSQQLDNYARHTADIYAYATAKCEELGSLCGLLGTQAQPTSEQLHLVVQLLSGISKLQKQGDGINNLPQSPEIRLQAALSSKDGFKKLYLELLEVSISTYKHIKQMRKAKMVGSHLADFYLDMGEYQLAEGFLLDMAKMYKDDRWSSLLADVLVKLVRCQKEISNTDRYLKSLLLLCSLDEVGVEERKELLQRLVSLAESVKDDDPLILDCEDIIEVVDIAEVHGKSHDPDTIIIQVELHSRLPANLPSSELRCSVHTVVEGASNTAAAGRLGQACDGRGAGGVGEVRCHGGGGGRLRSFRAKPELQVAPVLQEKVEWAPGRIISGSSIQCLNSDVVLRRQDSTGAYLDHLLHDGQKDDYSVSLHSAQVTITPGYNSIHLSCQLPSAGLYTVQQLCIELNGLHLIQNHIPKRLNFRCVREKPTLTLSFPSDMMSGLFHEVSLQLYTGSVTFTDNYEPIKINSPTYLIMRKQINDTDTRLSTNTLEISIPPADQFQQLTLPFCVFCDLTQHHGKIIEHTLVVFSPWSQQSQEFTLCFIPPFKVNQSLQTCDQDKYLQVTVHGNGPETFLLSEPRIEVVGVGKDERHMALTTTSFQDTAQAIPVMRDQNAFYMWSLADPVSPPPPPPPSNGASSAAHTAHILQCHFTIKYQCERSDLTSDYAPTKPYSHYFTMHQHMTLYSVSCKVEPGAGTSFCRAGNMCRLNVEIERVKESKKPSSSKCLMYEIVADHTLWVPCGKTAAVIEMPMSGEKTFHVTLDVMPLVTGYLPLPLARLSKYYPATGSGAGDKMNRKDVDGLQTDSDAVKTVQNGVESVRVADVNAVMTTPAAPSAGPRLEPLNKSQVYNKSRGEQVHVLPAMTSNVFEVAALPS